MLCCNKYLTTQTPLLVQHSLVPTFNEVESLEVKEHECEDETESSAAALYLQAHFFRSWLLGHKLVFWLGSSIHFGHPYLVEPALLF